MRRKQVFNEIKSWKISLHLLIAKIAKLYIRLLPNLGIIGISGSVGKTATQNAIYAVLSQKFRTVVPDENLDPTFRIPRTILKARPLDQKIILEYGVEHPKDMDYYLSIVKPKIAVLTRITPTHTKYFGNIQGVYAEKVKLIESLTRDDSAVLNANDPYSLKAALKTQAQVFWFGQKAKNGVKISHFVQDLKGSKFRLHYQGQKAAVSWKIIGKHHLTSAYAAATVGIICGLTIKQIASGLSKTKPPYHRLNLIRCKNFVIIDDTYNSSPKAAEESLLTLTNLAKRKVKIAILGEMKDLGNLEKIAHIHLGQKIAKTNINYLITVDKVASKIAQSAKKSGFSGKIAQASNVKGAIETLNRLNLNNSVILIKGSRHAHLERIVYALQHKSTAVNCYHCGELNI